MEIPHKSGAPELGKLAESRAARCRLVYEGSRAPSQPWAVAEQGRTPLRYTPGGSIDPHAMETVVDTLLKVQALAAQPLVIGTRPSLADLYTTQFTPVRP
jgi:hypothetical protein